MKPDDWPNLIADAARLDALGRTGLLDTPPEPSFDRLTRLAARLLRAPVALVSLVDTDRQFFKSSVGLPEPWASRRQTPLSHSFCLHEVVTCEPLIIEDARNHPLFCENAAISDLGVVAYLGIPLVTRDGHALGSLCAIDEQPRVWTETDVETLRDLAASVMTEIEFRAEIAERRRAEGELREIAGRLSLTLAASKMGDWTWDSATDLMTLSDRAAEIFGVSPGSHLTGTRMRQLLHERDRERVRLAVERSITGHEDYSIEYRVDRPNGERCWVAAMGRALYEPDGRVRGMLGVVQDITERKRAEEEAHRAREGAEAANRQKDQFLAMLSHELRNPLNPVLLAVTAALQDAKTPDDLRSTFEMIRQNVELEARLIDDLLDVMRVIRGKMHYQWGVVDAHELIGRALDICRSDWQVKQIGMVTDLTAGEHHVKADPARLQQVLWNLVKNAVKFTPEGGTVAVRTRSEGGRFVMDVTDTGIGIEPGDLGRIFNAFEQAEDPRTRKFGGLGLGLAISRSLAEAHGGTLSASSPGRDQGATFTLTVPAVAPAGSAGRATSPTASGVKEHRPYRVLLVEDDAMTSRIMAKLLRGLGHTVTTAHTITTALEAASPDLDLVVSDIGLPDGSGLDMMRRLKSEYDLRGIALTGFGADEDIAKSREAGFVAHLTKPIDFVSLEAMIQQAAG